MSDLAKLVGRSEDAIREQARKMGLGPHARGKYSLSAIARITGYDRGRIVTAAKRAGLILDRHVRVRGSSTRQKGRHYAIDEDGFERLLEELKKYPDGARLWRTHFGEWGGHFRNGKPKPEACLGCGRSDRAHYSRGDCRRCYDRRRAGLAMPEKDPGQCEADPGAKAEHDPARGGEERGSDSGGVDLGRSVVHSEETDDAEEPISWGREEK